MPGSSSPASQPALCHAQPGLGMKQEFGFKPGLGPQYSSLPCPALQPVIIRDSNNNNNSAVKKR